MVPMPLHQTQFNLDLKPALTNRAGSHQLKPEEEAVVVRLLAELLLKCTRPNRADDGQDHARSP